MKLSISLLALVLIPLVYSQRVDDSCLRGCGIGKGLTRIIGGTPVRSGEKYPWMAHLFAINEISGSNYRGFTCGGAIISRRHILTAAHCLPRGVQLVKVTIGSNDRQRGTVIDARKWYNHEQYNERQLTSDIAIIELPQAINFDSTKRPICLPQANINTNGASYKAAGWGKTDPTRPNENPILMEVDLNDYDLNRCKQLYQAGFITDTKICALGRGNKNICQGDSGGPLMLIANGAANVVGVVSSSGSPRDPSLGSCDPSLPSAYTRTSSFLGWINSKLAIAGAC